MISSVQYAAFASNISVFPFLTIVIKNNLDCSFKHDIFFHPWRFTIAEFNFFICDIISENVK